MSAPDADRTLGVISRRRRYTRWLFEMCRPYLGARVVEVGAGTGNQSRHLLDHARASGCEVMLTEADEARLRELRRLFPGASTALWRLPAAFPESSFCPDTFVSWNVLEHIEDDVAALRAMRDALPTGGRVVALAPAGPELFSALDRRLGHFRRYRRRELAAKARAAGLRPLVERPVDLPGALGWLALAGFLGRAGFPEGASGAFDLLAPVFGGLERALPPPWGLSVLLVAEVR